MAISRLRVTGASSLAVVVGAVVLAACSAATTYPQVSLSGAQRATATTVAAAMAAQYPGAHWPSGGVLQRPHGTAPVDRSQVLAQWSTQPTVEHLLRTGYLSGADVSFAVRWHRASGAASFAVLQFRSHRDAAAFVHAVRASSGTGTVAHVAGGTVESSGASAEPLVAAGPYAVDGLVSCDPAHLRTRCTPLAKALADTTFHALD